MSARRARVDWPWGYAYRCPWCHRTFTLDARRIVFHSVAVQHDDHGEAVAFTAQCLNSGNSPAWTVTRARSPWWRRLRGAPRWRDQEAA